MTVRKHCIEFFGPPAVLDQFAYSFVTLSWHKKLHFSFLGEVKSVVFCVLHVEEDFRDVSFDHRRKHVERRYGERCSHNDAQIDLLTDLLESREEFFWETFTEENDVRLDRLAAGIAMQNILISDSLLKSFIISILLALSTLSSSIGAMGLNDVSHIHPRLLLQIVNVLCHVLPQDSLVLEHLDEIVSGSRHVLRKIEVLRELVKWRRIFEEVIDRENRFWRWKVVLREIVINASPWRPEIGDACGD